MNLRQNSTTFIWHPPDGLGPWRPADWLYGSGHNWGAIEAKQTRLASLYGGEWTPQQQSFAHEVLRAGGHYWLIVRFNHGASNETLIYPGDTARLIVDTYENLNPKRDPQLRRIGAGVLPYTVENLCELVLGS